MHDYYIYIVSSISGALYIGMTNNLVRRIYEHKNKLINGFTKRYNIDRLVYYEHYKYVLNAIERESKSNAGTEERKLCL